MLPRKYRLPLRTDLVRVQEKGKLFQGRLFSLLVAKRQPITNHQSPVTRFGFIISTKINKKAVRRNRPRRLLVEAVRELLPKIKPGFDCVFLAKKAIIGTEIKEIKKETERLFREVNLTI